MFKKHIYHTLILKFQGNIKKIMLEFLKVKNTFNHI